MKNADRFHEIIEQNHLNTTDLLAKLREEGMLEAEEGTDSIFRFARSRGVGLARDGYWYTAAQNAEVSEAISQDRMTFLAEQYFRNRN
jgi:hypothetical protein